MYEVNEEEGAMDVNNSGSIHILGNLPYITTYSYNRVFDRTENMNKCLGGNWTCYFKGQLQSKSKTMHGAMVDSGCMRHGSISAQHSS